MKINPIVLIILLLSFSFSIQAEVKLIPLPIEIKPGKKSFEFDVDTRLVLQPYDSIMKETTSFFCDLVRSSTGFPLPVVSGKAGKNSLVCRINSRLEKEAYRLKVTKDGIVVEASDAAGIFYGLQTIRQLLPATIETPVSMDIGTQKWSIDCVEIHDKPSFEYRGMMLDVCRHFMPKEFVMRMIDLLAFHKMNTFHWHLTDDQGWRIEIKKYPKLTAIGASRRMEIAGHKNAPDWSWKVEKHDGFYTQEDIKEVVEYARKRHVTIIPEIEMPGHALAALAAYPELSCSGGPFEVVGRWGVFHDIYCSREETIEFLQHVVCEVADLFPGEYFHLGGDEAPKTRWKRCKSCQDRMASEGIDTENQLQTYFVGRIEEVLKKKGKKVICWDDAVDAEIPQSITIMSWRGEEGGIKAARLGNDVIMTPHRSVYLDYYQGNKSTEPLTIGGFLPLEKVYDYQPIPKELNQEESLRIKGIQANVWTEYMPDEKHVEYMVFPRLAALAEIAWSNPENRDMKAFSLRLKAILQHYDYMNINYRKQDRYDE